MARRASKVLRTVDFTHKRQGRTYIAKYDLLEGLSIRVRCGEHTSRSTQYSGGDAEAVAHMLLDELIDQGKAEPTDESDR